jgi:acyl-CoA dehydrogenase
MIAFTPTDEQKMLIDAIRRYAEGPLRKVAHDADEASDTPADVVSKGWELGLLPGLIPEAYGGYSEGDAAVTGALVLEELAWGDASIAMTLWAPANFALSVLHAGSEEQKKQYLPAFCDVDRPIATAALTEPSVLFDPWRPQTTATRSGDTITLNGAKTFVPLATDAERMIVYATNSETGKVDGYIVEKDTPGVTVGERVKLMGFRAVPMFTVTLTNAAVPAENKLGGDAGTDYVTILNRSRIALGALAVGVSRASFEYARDYAKERVQFGSPIATKQAIAFRLAEVAIEVDAARLMVWEAAWKADQGEPLTQDVTVLKHYIDKMAIYTTDSGVQVLGGHGYIREHPVERWLRNARGFATLDGLALV